jgi:hypothetical protein
MTGVSLFGRCAKCVREHDKSKTTSTNANWAKSKSIKQKWVRGQSSELMHAENRVGTVK